MLQASKTIVFGLGNTIRSDDGVGVHALERLRQDPRLPRDVELIDGGTKGLELACYASEAGKLLLIDAVDVGEPPGTVVRFEGSDLWGLPGGKSAHELGLADLLATLSLVADQPQEIVILGVQPAETGWGTALSPDVEASVQPLLDAAIRQLTSWTAPVTGISEGAASPVIEQQLPTV